MFRVPSSLPRRNSNGHTRHAFAREMTREAFGDIRRGASLTRSVLLSNGYDRRPRGMIKHGPEAFRAFNRDQQHIGDFASYNEAVAAIRGQRS